MWVRSILRMIIIITNSQGKTFCNYVFNISLPMNTCQKSMQPQFSCAENDLNLTYFYFAKIGLADYINANCENDGKDWKKLFCLLLTVIMENDKHMQK